MQQPIFILFGSQTGTAEDVAEQCTTMGRHRGIERIILSCMNDCTIDQIRAQPCTVVFICSTAGQGEEPDNMLSFWRTLLRRSLPADLFSDVSFAVLGLGDSSYQKFNFAAKKLYRRLLQLGAQALMPLGLADDQHDLGADGVCEPWLAELWQKLTPDAVVTERLLPPKFQIEWLPKEGGMSAEEGRMGAEEVGLSAEERHGACGAEEGSAKADGTMEADCARPPMATLVPLVSNKRMTAEDHFQDTRLLTLDLTGHESSLTYGPGDVLCVQPSNLDDTVNAFVEFYGIADKLDHRIHIKPPATGRLPALLHQASSSTGITLQYIVKHYLDLQSVPRRSFFAHLALHADDELEKERLTELCAPGNQDDMYAYASRPRRTIMETLRDFPKTSAKVPIDYWFDLIPGIKPRAFSIASCYDHHRTQLQLIVAIVNYKTRLSVPRQGLCSTWLSHLQPGDLLPVWLRRGTFKFPDDPSHPVILIGPGTGIAPLRNYLWYRHAHTTAQSDKSKCWLFFGCRSSMADFYFESEWSQLDCELVVAFSRDGQQKVYVQHKIREHAKQLWALLSQHNACIFLSGSANQMPKSVIKEFEAMATDAGLDGHKFVENLERTGRFQMETWS